MKYLYTFYDAASGVHSSPLALPADAVARRVFQDILLAGNSDMSKYPADFSLFRVGAFDEADGVLIPEKPVLLVSATKILDDLKASEAASSKSGVCKIDGSGDKK